MRPVREWDEAYLLNLPVGEFDWLEVKGRRGLDLTVGGVRDVDVRENLSRALSAFANSGGGVIVLGLANPRNVWQVDDGGIDLAVRKPSTREWLEDIIPNLVDFPLTGFNVYVIGRSSDTSTIAAGRGVFVIDVPDSEQAPHQATDNKYYARVGGKSRPIPHRLVLDILGRRRHPSMELGFEIEITNEFERSYIPIGVSEPKRKVKLVVRATNAGRIYAQFVNIILYIPVLLMQIDEYGEPDEEITTIDGSDYFTVYLENTRRDVIGFGSMSTPNYGPSWFDPVLPGLSFQRSTQLSEGFDRATLTDERIIWAVYADNAPRKRGELLVREINVIDNT